MAADLDTPTAQTTAKDPVYQPISRADIQTEVDELIKSFDRFLKVYKKLPSDVVYRIDHLSIVTVVRRTHMRKCYYKFFHKGMEISEEKEVSLYAYWILKYHPFVIADKRCDDGEYVSKINEYFAIYLITGVYLNVNGIKKIDFVKNGYVQKLLYAFRYRPLSMESIMLLVESLDKDLYKKRFYPEHEPSLC